MKIQNDLQRWNKEVFGNIFVKNTRLMCKLDQLNRRMSFDHSNYLVDKMQEVWSKYEEVLIQEEVFWFQKARSKWLAFRDTNSSYFHGTTVIRRRSRVDIIQDEDDVWISDPEQLKNLATGFYKSLFAESDDYVPYVVSGMFPTLNSHSLSALGAPVTFQEVYNTVRSMGAFKAPVPDGFQAVFYQSQWEVVGETLWKMVQMMFLNHQQIGEINETLITLIPKVDNVVKMKQLRPISLCNVSYKVITKLLAHRLRPLMGKLVSLCQCSFIPNRQSRDNIVIAQEVFHSMCNKKGSKGWMAIKIDLEKAYDRLSWKFVQDTLIDIGCPENFSDIVWQCLSSPTMRLLWIGEALEEFKPMKGVRQGDPISPYLFILCIERLFQLILITVDNKLWKPIQIAREALKLSHLAFADDLLIFVGASEDRAEVISNVLNMFCKSSGQKVINDKSWIFFSKNVGWQKRDDISQRLGFSRTKSGKILRCPNLPQEGY